MKKLIIAMLLVLGVGVSSKGYTFSEIDQMIAFNLGNGVTNKLKAERYGIDALYNNTLKIYYQLNMEYTNRNYSVRINLIDKDGFVVHDSYIGEFTYGSDTCLRGNFIITHKSWEKAHTIQLFYR